MRSSRLAIWSLAVVLAAAAAAWGADAAAEAPAKKLSVALITGGHGYDHANFMKVFEAPDLAVTHSDQKVGGEIFENIDDWKYDVMVLYNFNQKITEPQQANFLKLMDKGVGLLVLHHANGAYNNWPEFWKIAGVTYYFGKSGFKGGVKFKIHVADPKHPITKGMEDYEFTDETYCKTDVDPANHVLLTTDEPSSDKVIGWTKTCRKSNVCYLQSGHDNAAYSHPVYKPMVQRAIRWVAGVLKDDAKAAATLPFTASRSAAAEEKEVGRDDFKPLLNGKDFTGWKADDEQKKHWTIEDGILKHDGKGKDLWTEAKYTDFVLKVDWRMPKAADSGIYVRGSSKCQANIWCDPLGSGEVYGYRTDAMQPEEVRKGCTPKKKADKPVGEWNSFFITMKGDRLTVVLNGEEVIASAQLPDCPKDGPIALQSHGDPMEFRNIAVKEIK